MKKLGKLVVCILGIALSFATPSTMNAFASVETLSQDGAFAEVKVTSTIAGQFEVIIPKQIDLDETSSAQANISAKGDILASQTLKLTTDKDVELTTQGKDAITAFVSLSKETFSCTELVNGGNSVMVVSVPEISAGSWSGSYKVYVSIENMAQNNGGENIDVTNTEEVSISSEDVLITDENGTDLNATVTVLSDTTEWMAQLDASGLAKSEDISMVASINCDSYEGTATMVVDVSSFANNGEQIALYSYDENAGTWEHVATQTVSNGCVTAQFSSLRPVAFEVIREEKTEHSHSYEIATTKEGTCLEAGELTYSCACGDSYTEEIPATGHDYTSTVTEGNCVEGGTVHYECRNCAHKYNETLPATGHNYVATITAPSCTKDGYTTHTCSKCEDSYTDSAVSASGHNILGGSCTECNELFAGLYSDASYTTMTKGWDTLISNGTLSVTDGALKCNDKTMSGYLNVDDSVTSLAGSALYGCESLYGVKMTKSVTSLGNQCFGGCKGLTSVGAVGSGSSVEIPSSVTSFGTGIFMNCEGLTKVVLPNTATTLGMSFFSGCDGLTSVGTVGSGASVELPNSITSIDTYAFSDCEGLTEVTLPNGIASIGKRAFSSCGALVTVNIPSSVVTIEEEAFYACAVLSAVTISNGVKTIGDGAFGQCFALTRISIPNSVTSLGEDVFADCSHLSDVTLSEKLTSIGIRAFRGCTSLTNIVIPNAVTSIEKYAFSGCTALTDLRIPDGVTSIGSDAFKNVPHITYNGTATGSPWGATAIN